MALALPRLPRGPRLRPEARALPGLRKRRARRCSRPHPPRARPAYAGRLPVGGRVAGWWCRARSSATSPRGADRPSGGPAGPRPAHLERIASSRWVTRRDLPGNARARADAGPALALPPPLPARGGTSPRDGGAGGLPDQRSAARRAPDVPAAGRVGEGRRGAREDAAGRRGEHPPRGRGDDRPGDRRGIETALSIVQHAAWSPVWAAGSAAGIEALPELQGIDALTVFVDSDDGGAGLRAGLSCAARWRAAGRQADVWCAPAGADFFDALRGDGQ